MANNGNTATEQGKGGGPKTEASKAIAARNSASHGITSPNPVIPGMETEQDWQAHLDGVRQSLDPRGHLESELADRIALCLWQLKRVTRHTVALTANSIADVEIDYVHGVMITHGIQAVLDAAEGKRHDLPVPTQEELAQTREVRLMPSSRELDKIMRYESHLHRLIVQTLRDLEALQARRLGRPVHLYRSL
ncbi:MAG: hypothetical protein IH865_06605 [Chloroflexi bacterium]|nr:hypothetical protein [Chloroflexota bacterium]